jgi:hypothetical protein
VHGRGFESLMFGSMVVGSNLCLFGGQWWCSAWSRVQIFLPLDGQWWCIAWSWVRIFVLWDQWWCSAWSWVRIFDFVGVNGDVVHVVGLNICRFGGHQWCSAWSWVRIFVISGVINGGVMHCLGFEILSFGVNGGVVHGRGFVS